MGCINSTGKEGPAYMTNSHHMTNSPPYAHPQSPTFDSLRLEADTFYQHIVALKETRGESFIALHAKATQLYQELDERMRNPDGDSARHFQQKLLAIIREYQMILAKVAEDDQ